MNLQPYLKTIFGFLSLVVVNAASDWMNHGAPIPETWQDGLRWFLTIVAGTVIVYRVPNLYTVPQATQKLDTAKHRLEEGKQKA